LTKKTKVTEGNQAFKAGGVRLHRESEREREREKDAVRFERDGPLLAAKMSLKSK